MDNKILLHPIVEGELDTSTNLFPLTKPSLLLTQQITLTYPESDGDAYLIMLPIFIPLVNLPDTFDITLPISAKINNLDASYHSYYFTSSVNAYIDQFDNVVFTVLLTCLSKVLETISISIYQ